MSNQPKKNNKKTPAKKSPAKKAVAKKAPAKKSAAKKAPAKKAAAKKAPAKQKTSATPKQEEVITITIDPIIEAEERTELVKAISAPEKPKGLKGKIKSIFGKK